MLHSIDLKGHHAPGGCETKEPGKSTLKIKIPLCEASAKRKMLSALPCD